MSFILLFSIFAIGAFGSLLFLNRDEEANAWQGFFGIAGSLWGVMFALLRMFAPQDLVFSANSSVFSLLSFSFRIDRLSAFFIFLISFIALLCSIYGIGYVRHYFHQYSIGALGFFYLLFIAGMLAVVSSSNALLFLIVWEIMSIASYVLVVYDRNDQKNVEAGFLYLVMTHIGTAFILLAFVLLFRFTASFDFEAIRLGIDLVPATTKNIVFILALIGFGTKAGMIPFHIWLPSAHPAAPSHVSALMSGVMIKTGIYMMIRMFFDLLGPVPLWWGGTILVIGMVSALLGVLYALTEHDIKKLLAYHSIENIGIILLGIGGALVFSSYGNSSLALFGLGAALFHTLNHATFKSLLFLSAGSVIAQTHTRNIEEYGGLIKTMPRTAFFFLIGSMAISALPPFNGFFSEWLTFQTLLQGMASADLVMKSIFVLAAGALAMTGGLALACFVKAFGATFLARPRSPEVLHAQESSFSLSLAMGTLGACCLLFGIFSGLIGSWLVKVGSSLQIFQHAPFFVSAPSVIRMVAPNGFGSVSALTFFILFLLLFFAVFFLVRFGIYQRQKNKIGNTWDCGVDLTPRMEITATGFARSIIVIFAGVLRPSIQHDVEYHDAETRYLARSNVVSLQTRDIALVYFYQPLRQFVNAVSLRVKSIQGGNINMYVFYMLIAVVLALAFSL